jgi:hypothetical protein
MRVVALCVVALLLAGCEREKAPSPYSPTGDYFQRLDASGRKHIVRGDDDERLAKLRVRDHEIKVYDAEMISIGTVGWRESGSDEHDVIVVTPRGGDQMQLERSDGQEDVYELPGRFRLERVERGWGIFDAEGHRLGYVEELEEGDFALRDDYSSPPRAYARAGEPDVKSPAGRIVVRANPELRSAPLLAFALEGELTPLDRMALGLWLERVKPSK